MGKRQLLILIALLAVILVGSLAILYFQIEQAGDMWPYEDEPGTLTNEINRLDSEVRNLKQEVAKIPAAKERLEQVQIEYDLATRVLPRESSPDQLIAAIRTKAEMVGVIPVSLRPSVSTPRGGRGASGGAFEEWSFDLSIQGNYDEIASFVNRMEEFESSDPTRVGSEKRFFEVRSIDIAAKENGMAGLSGVGSEKYKHACSLNMVTYRYAGSE